MILVTGIALIALGIMLIPLPGPGLAVILAGLALLATEYAWARDLLAFVKRKLGRPVKATAKEKKSKE